MASFREAFDELQNSESGISSTAYSGGGTNNSARRRPISYDLMHDALDSARAHACLLHRQCSCLLGASMGRNNAR